MVHLCTVVSRKKFSLRWCPCILFNENRCLKLFCQFCLPNCNVSSSFSHVSVWHVVQSSCVEYSIIMQEYFIYITVGFAQIQTPNASCIHWLLHWYHALQWCLRWSWSCLCVVVVVVAWYCYWTASPSLCTCCVFLVSTNIPCTHGGCHRLHLALVASLIVHTFCRKFGLFRAIKLQLYIDNIHSKNHCLHHLSSLITLSERLT